MRILLIEDDTLIGDGLKTGLSKMGFSIDWFTEGRQGKEALYSADPRPDAARNRRTGHLARMASQREAGASADSDRSRRAGGTR